MADLVHGWLRDKRTRVIPLRQGDINGEPTRLDPLFKVLVPLHFLPAST